MSLLRPRRSSTPALFALAALTLLSCPPAAAQTPAQTLTASQRVERELKGDEAHAYGLDLKAGDYLQAVVEQKGIDVVVTLFGPGGEKIVEVDSPNGSQGPEPLSALAASAGTHRLEVRSLEAGAPAGRYEVRVEELRPSTPRDADRLAAVRLMAEGEHLDLEGTAESLRKAAARYEEALAPLRRVGDQGREASALTLLGRIHFDLGEKERALGLYAEALRLAEETKDAAQQATVLSNTGVVHSSTGDKQKALEYYRRALPFWQSSGDRTGEASTLINMGKAHSDTGDKREARRLYQLALKIKQEVGDQQGEATALGNIGAVSLALGEVDEALEQFRRSLKLFEAVGDARGVATLRSNIALVLEGEGRKREALEMHEQSLALARQAGDANQESSTLSNIGQLYYSLGEMQKALDNFAASLELTRRLQNRRGEAITLANIGATYSSLGDRRAALDAYRQSLAISRAVGDRLTANSTLSNIGVAHHVLGEYDEAFKVFNEVLAVKREIGDRPGEAYALSNLGAVYALKGDAARALEFQGQALAIRRAIKDRLGEAVTLENIARVFYERKEYPRALELLRQALALTRAVQGREQEASVLYNLALTLRDSGDYAAALPHAREATAIMETTRTSVAGEELRTSYFATAQDAYLLHISVLMGLHARAPAGGHDRAAWEVFERSRARGLLDALAESRAHIREGVDASLLARERTLQEQLNDAAFRQKILLNGEHTPEQAAAAAARVQSLTGELQQTRARIRQTSPRYASLSALEPLDSKRLQSELLDADTMLLEYALGKEKSYLWAVTPASFKSFELAGGDEINAAARRLYKLLQAPAGARPAARRQRRGAEALPAGPSDAELNAATAALSRLVLGPVAAELGTKRLVVVASGDLQAIPFAALSKSPAPAGARRRGAARAARPLVLDHEVVHAPSATTLAVLRAETAGRAPAGKTLAVLADPVFSRDDERVKARTAESPTPPAGSPEEGGGRGVPAVEALRYERLPGTRREAEQILSLVPAAEARSALDFEASRATATGDQLGRYRYVHLATHGFIDPAHPELSGVALSMVDERGRPQDGFLRAHEIFNLRLPVEMVVLSACETGYGRDMRGEGLMSLTRGFMYAGAPRVVVSLWKVNDASTAGLMSAFYRNILVGRQRPAQALRAAQLKMLRDGLTSPSHWAAFTLQGEWR